MGIISWLIIGALAGWLASMITGNNASMGALANIIVGIVGGLIGGFIMNFFGGTGITGFNIWSLQYLLFVSTTDRIDNPKKDYRA